MRRRTGFTLIELLITIAIIGILTAIAFPSYTSYVQRGRIAEAINQLATMRVQLEQYYQDNRNYGSTNAACGNNIGTVDGQSFAFSCNYGTVASNQGFLITATGKAASGMTGFAFTIDQDNTRQTTAFPGASGLPLSCWISRKGDTC